MKWKALPLLLLIILGGSVAGLFTIGMGGPFFFTQTESPVSGKPETPKDSPEFVVDRFVRSLDRGRFPEAVALLVDSTGKPLDDKLKDAYLKDWASALGEGGELVDIGRTTVTGKSPLNQETLSKAGAEEAYLLTVAITGESRTKCWKLPVDKVAIAVVRTQAGWRVMESWDSWQGMFFFRCSAAGEQTILPTAGGVKVELVNITLSEIRRIDDFSRATFDVNFRVTNLGNERVHLLRMAYDTYANGLVIGGSELGDHSSAMREFFTIGVGQRKTFTFGEVVFTRNAPPKVWQAVLDGMIKWRFVGRATLETRSGESRADFDLQYTWKR